MRSADERSGVGTKGMLWECLRCSDPVAAADRLEAEAEGPEFESGVDDESGIEDHEDRSSFISSLDNFTDTSGSVGSVDYSEYSGVNDDWD